MAWVLVRVERVGQTPLVPVDLHVMHLSAAERVVNGVAPIFRRHLARLSCPLSLTPHASRDACWQGVELCGLGARWMVGEMRADDRRYPILSCVARSRVP